MFRQARFPIVFLGLSAVILMCPGLLSQTVESPKSSKPQNAEDGNQAADPAKSVAQLVDRLKASPVKPTTAAGRVGLYLIDLTTDELVLIADQPEPGVTHCGSSTWSHDGKRILYDATPDTQWVLTHIKAISLIGNELRLVDLGSGNCPIFSPDDKRIAFLNNSTLTENGIWMMNADGTQRKFIGDYGRPRWSPDGRQLLIVPFGNPTEPTIMDADPAKSGPVELTDHQFFSVPSWVRPAMILAVLGNGTGDTLALVDVSKPTQARVEKVLWKRSGKLDVEPIYPVYSPITRRYVFAAGTDKGLALYTFTEGDSNPPRRLEPDGLDKILVSLALSPDGRYLLFNSDRADRHSRPPSRPGKSAQSR